MTVETIGFYIACLGIGLGSWRVTAFGFASMLYGHIHNVYYNKNKGTENEGTE